MRSAGRWHAEIWLQPRQAFRLRASRDRADCHAGWFSIGLRSHGRQHLGQDDTEGVFGQDRKAIWQGQTHVGDGSRHSDRGSVGRDAKFKNADPLSGRLAARAAHATREGVFDETVGGRARERAGQTDRTRGRDICFRSQRRPTRQGAIDAAAAVEKTDQAPARTAKAKPDARRTIAQTRRGQERMEAHIFIAFLAYCLFVTLKLRLKTLAPGLTPRAALEKLAAMQMIDVELPTTDDRVVVLSRYTEPEKDLLLLLRQLKIQLPAQPPPKIKARNNHEVA